MSIGMAMGAPRERMVEKALALIVEAEIAPDQAAHARLALSQWRGKSPEHAAAHKDFPYDYEDLDLQEEHDEL